MGGIPARFGLALVAALCSHAALGAESTLGFYSGGQFRDIEIVKDSVAVAVPPGAEPHVSKQLTTDEVAAFASMGVAVIPSGMKHGETLGVPFWFDRDKGAVGVLGEEIIVKIKGPAALAALRRAKGFRRQKGMPGAKGVVLAAFSTPMAAMRAANELYTRRDVAYAHPNFLAPKDSRGVPTERFFRDQWHLQNQGQLGGASGADAGLVGAWDVTEGDSSILIAVLDGGFEVTHPDLDGAIYRNPGEIARNGVDDDRNGYVDDVAGWNFARNSNDPSKGNIVSHGTAVIGLVGARKNGVGVIGTCPNCSLLPITLSFQGATVTADAAAIRYATAMKADIITNSWGYAVGTPTTDAVEEALADAATNGRGGKGAIVLFAMSNDNQDNCSGASPDISALDSVIAISASTDLDKKKVVAGWGDCMELQSPADDGGRYVATTDVTGVGGYNSGPTQGELSDLAYTNRFGGTSAATPIAAGIFGLMLSVNDSLTRNEALAMMLAAANKVHPELANYNAKGFSSKYGYGRIDAAKAVSTAELFRKYTKKDKEKGPAKDRASRGKNRRDEPLPL